MTFGFSAPAGHGESESKVVCDRGTQPDGLEESTTIGLEIDGLDEQQQIGWSVLVVGPAKHLWDPAKLARVRKLPLQPWAAGEKANIVGISPMKITGRRIRRPV